MASQKLIHAFDHRYADGLPIFYPKMSAYDIYYTRTLGPHQHKYPHLSGNYASGHQSHILDLQLDPMKLFFIFSMK